MYICYILPVPANDIAIENIFFYTFWFKYSTSIYKYIFNLCYYLFFKRNVFLLYYRTSMHKIGSCYFSLIIKPI